MTTVVKSTIYIALPTDAMGMGGRGKREEGVLNATNSDSVLELLQ
jgi:hypothetical protein